MTSHSDVHVQVNVYLNLPIRMRSQQFGIALSTAHDCVTEFCMVISATVHDYIKIPVDQAEIQIIADELSVYGYPNVYGAIDGTKVDVTVPAFNKGGYFTRKYTTSINLTAVGDASKRLLSVTTGFCGRCHDSHIFKSSGFGQQTLRDTIIPSQYHLIGDAAYGLHTNVMVPYPATVESDLTILHNNRHSSNHRCQKYSYSTCCYHNFFLANTSQECTFFRFRH